MNLWNIFGKRIRWGGGGGGRGKFYHDINTSTTFQRSIIILYVYRASSYFQTGAEINRRNIEYFAGNISFESRRNIDIFLNKGLMAGARFRARKQILFKQTRATNKFSNETKSRRVEENKQVKNSSLFPSSRLHYVPTFYKI